MSSHHCHRSGRWKRRTSARPTAFMRLAFGTFLGLPDPGSSWATPTTSAPGGPPTRPAPWPPRRTGASSAPTSSPVGERRVLRPPDRRPGPVGQGGGPGSPRRHDAHLRRLGRHPRRPVHLPPGARSTWPSTRATGSCPASSPRSWPNRSPGPRPSPPRTEGSAGAPPAKSADLATVVAGCVPVTDATYPGLDVQPRDRGDVNPEARRHRPRLRRRRRRRRLRRLPHRRRLRSRHRHLLRQVRRRPPRPRRRPAASPACSTPAKPSPPAKGPRPSSPASTPPGAAPTRRCSTGATRPS